MEFLNNLILHVKKGFYENIFPEDYGACKRGQITLAYKTKYANGSYDESMMPKKVNYVWLVRGDKSPELSDYFTTFNIKRNIEFMPQSEGFTHKIWTNQPELIRAQMKNTNNPEVEVVSFEEHKTELKLYDIALEHLKPKSVSLKNLDFYQYTNVFGVGDIVEHSLTNGEMTKHYILLGKQEESTLFNLSSDLYKSSKSNNKIWVSSNDEMEKIKHFPSLKGVEIALLSQDADVFELPDFSLNLKTKEISSENGKIERNYTLGALGSAVDMLKYSIAYLEGGIIADIDYRFEPSIGNSPIFASNFFAPGLENSLFGATPSHPTLLHVMKEIEDIYRSEAGSILHADVYFACAYQPTIRHESESFTGCENGNYILEDMKLQNVVVGLDGCYSAHHSWS